MVRYLKFILPAFGAVFLVFWIGARIAGIVAQGTSESAEFLRGAHVERCGYSIDHRYDLAGYELDRWKGSRCESLSDFDHCLLGCLERAETIRIAERCYAGCLGRRDTGWSRGLDDGPIPARP